MRDEQFTLEEKLETSMYYTKKNEMNEKSFNDYIEGMYDPSIFKAYF